MALSYLSRAEESAGLHKEQAVMSSLRKRRKAVQAAVRRNNSWNWSFDKFVRVVVTATNKMSKAMEEAYAKSRAAREAHDQVG